MNDELNQSDRPASHARSSRPNPTIPWLVAGVLVLLVAGLGFAFLTKSDQTNDAVKKDDTAVTPAGTASDWQAVFLNNGQVYFGHLSGTDTNNFTLKDIYYLQAQQPLQPVEDQDAAKAQQQLSLVKLGRFELHCPVDEMTINRDQVIFWEKLKTDSQVVQAIGEYVKTDDASKKCYEGAPQQQAPAEEQSAETATTVKR